ncbi:hypothetical protein BB560_001456 [Smittium megazygosporum]|uniref:NTF2-related export protein n=1 Tax=Smittium megazygosporum TaxID=133381 RepID=A0A2T9ZHL0_9FUNG|nr:hypothetical protein BB560_001456 [Smittium megazygosporum]
MSTISNYFNSQKFENENNDSLKKAQDFVYSYYKNMKSNPKKCLQNYLSTARISWNGRGFTKKVFGTEVLEKLPKANVRILSFDSHPFYVGSVLKGIIVVISGNWSESHKDNQLFSQTLFLTKSTDRYSGYYIQDDCFRFV